MRPYESYYVTHLELRLFVDTFLNAISHEIKFTKEYLVLLFTTSLCFKVWSIHPFTDVLYGSIIWKQTRMNEESTRGSNVRK